VSGGGHARPGAVRQQGPAFGVGASLGFRHAVFIGGSGPDNISAPGLESGFKGSRHGFGHEDDGLGPKQRSACRKGHAVVPGARTDKGPAGQRGGVRLGKSIPNAAVRQFGNRIGRAKCLEAAKAHALPFVLESKVADSKTGREVIRNQQRGFIRTRAFPKKVLCSGDVLRDGSIRKPALLGKAFAEERIFQCFHHLPRAVSRAGQQL
jgi:hypothetical protein